MKNSNRKDDFNRWVHSFDRWDVNLMEGLLGRRLPFDLCGNSEAADYVWNDDDADGWEGLEDHIRRALDLAEPATADDRITDPRERLIEMGGYMEDIRNRIAEAADLFPDKKRTVLRKYNSIENYTPEFNVRLQTMFPDSWKEIKFYAQEKIHGANFSIHYASGGEVRFATRNHFIKEGENFYGYQKIFADMDLRKKLKDYFCMSDGGMADGTERVAIYGEICGGWYPGENDNDSTRVQKGVAYSSRNQFLVFDVWFEGGSHRDSYGNRIKGGSYLSPYHVDELCRIIDLHYLDPLTTGSLDHCLRYPVQFNSSIGFDYFRHKRIPENIAEGLVIKPVNDDFKDRFGSRFMFKRKAERFMEVARAKKEQIVFSDETLKYHKMTPDYCNHNRLDSVISKMGREVSDLTMRDFSEMIKLMAQDAIADFVKDNPDFPKLEKPQQSIVRRELGRHCAVIIKEFFTKRA